MISQRIQSFFTGTESVPASTAEPQSQTQTDQQKVDELLSSNGDISSNSITDEIFYIRHPELKGKLLDKDSPLASEWKQIKAEVVEPRMNQTQTTPSPTSTVPQTTEAGSSFAAEARGILDMGAGLLQQKLQSTVDTGRSLRDSMQNKFQASVEAGKSLYHQAMGEKEVQIAPGTPPAPAADVSEAAKAETRAKGIAFEITGVFETGKPGGDPGTVQTSDTGIISYGKHQATLASEADSLEKVLDEYINTSDSDTSKKLEPFMDRVRTKDATLKDDQNFIQLLKDAGADPKMSEAQDEVFGKNYWEPAMKLADEAGVKSPLGKALIYDSMIQHRPDTVSKLIERSKAKLEGKEYTEQEFLQTFAEERKKHLLGVAAALGKSTNPLDLKTAEDCERDATRKRVVEWKELIDSGNLQLAGDINIYGQTIHAG
jgi:hypothetical protein